MKSNSSPEPWSLAAIAALRFDRAAGAGLYVMAGSHCEWLIDQADRAHVTLPLAVRCRGLFPRDGQRRLDASLERNGQCHRRAVMAYREIAEAFDRGGVPHLLLKGLAQSPWYVDDPVHRSQSDIDIYCPPGHVDVAAETLSGLGYQPVQGTECRHVDHLPVMIRHTGWKWAGDFYDPERPPSVELHFRFWDADTEGFSAGDAEAFWRGRTTREIAGLRIPTLNRADGLAYSAMHLIRHLLRGDLQIRHVYELAHFLEQSADDDEFWRAESVSLVEAIAFRLAVDWFGCRMNAVAAEFAKQLPSPVERWFRLFALSPAAAIVKPNKDELWLHMSLVEERSARLRIAVRRLLPVKRQKVVLDPHVPAHGNRGLSIRRKLYAARFMAGRLIHHAGTVAPMIGSGLRWWKAGAFSR